MIKDYFRKNKYAYVSNVIPKERAVSLSDHLIKLKEQEKLVQDRQCPKSWAIYSYKEFDRVLEEICPALSVQLGIELRPAYTYARYYVPGEVLKKHTDRPSCEISGTMTLDYDKRSDIWPIYMKYKDGEKQEAIIEKGDMVIYRGNEVAHWREEYKGKWQSQVFFHFIDANGPYSQWEYDKRRQLAHHK